MNFAKRREIVINTAVTLVAADVDCGSNPIIAADRQSAESSARAIPITHRGPVLRDLSRVGYIG